MAFTLKWLVPPWGLWIIVGLLWNANVVGKEAGATIFVLTIWGAIANVVVIAYWIGRAFQAARKDSQPKY